MTVTQIISNAFLNGHIDLEDDYQLADVFYDKLTTEKNMVLLFADDEDSWIDITFTVEFHNNQFHKYTVTEIIGEVNNCTSDESDNIDIVRKVENYLTSQHLY